MCCMDLYGRYGFVYLLHSKPWKELERSGVSGLQRIMDPLHGLLLESRGFWCEVVKKITLSLYVKPKILFRNEAPLLRKDFGSDSQTHDLKSHGGLENLPHMTSHQNILLNERAVLRFLHLSSAVMTYIHPWKLTWNTIVDVWFRWSSKPTTGNFFCSRD